MDRVFGTVQNRLPQELRLSKIFTLEAANRYLKEQFLPDYNACFAVPAAAPGSAFVPYSGRPLEDVLCIQEDRQAARNNYVVWKGRTLQIPPQQYSCTRNGRLDVKGVNIDWINARYVEAAHKLMEIALIDGIQLSTLGLVPRSLARELRVPSRSDQDSIRGDWSSSRAATCPEFV